MAAPGRPSGPLPRRPFVTTVLVLAIVMCVKAFYNLAQGGPADPAHGPTNANLQGNLVYAALWLSLYLSSASIVAWQVWRRGLPYRLLGLLAVGAYVVASASWAENWAGSIAPATMLLLDVIVAAALAMTVHPARFLRTVAIINVVLMVVSLILVVVAPSLAISDPTRPGLFMAGEMLGAYDTKGTLGLSACVSIVVLLFGPFSAETLRIRLPCILVLTVGLLLANSVGSLAATAVAVSPLLVARRFPALQLPVMGGMTLLAVLWSILLPFINIGAVTELLGRSSDLTGRGTFWPMAPGFIADRPWFGFGYLAFFRPEPFARGWEVWNREQWFFTPEFHNAFLDILIGLGAVGAAAYVAILVSAATVVANHTLEARCRLVMNAVLIIYIMGGATEFDLLSHNSFGTLFLFYCCLVAGRSYGAVPRAAPRPVPGVPQDRDARIGPLRGPPAVRAATMQAG